MRILTVHNYYQQPGGEDRIFETESLMLEKHGCQVFRYTLHNNYIKRMNILELVRSTFWNKTTVNELVEVIQQSRPDVVHFHNTFPLISPAAYYTAKAKSIAVVQTLNNYRLLCPCGLYFRKGHVCEECTDKFVAWPSLIHACYRGNRFATGATVAMLSVHKALRTWARMVDVYIAAMTDYESQKFIREGIPETKIIVKPNFVDPDPGIGKGQGGYALFVGRLSQEKGIDTLLSSWELVGNKLPLKIAGDGPLSLRVTEATKNNAVAEFLGRQPKSEILRLMKNATVLIFPSIWYECFPLTMIEAFSVGLPVIASKLGSMSSLIEHGRTGLHFRPGDPMDLAKKVIWAIDNPEKIKQMRFEAREEYERKYTAEINYKMLMDIYKTAIEHSKTKS